MKTGYNRWHGSMLRNHLLFTHQRFSISLIRLSDSMCRYYKVTQKSIFTYSEVRCQRCHRDLTAFADLGVVVGIDMNKKRSKEDVDRLECYMTHLVGVIRNCKSSD